MAMVPLKPGWFTSQVFADSGPRTSAELTVSVKIWVASLRAPLGAAGGRGLGHRSAGIGPGDGKAAGVRDNPKRRAAGEDLIGADAQRPAAECDRAGGELAERAGAGAVELDCEGRAGVEAGRRARQLAAVFTGQQRAAGGGDVADDAGAAQSAAAEIDRRAALDTVDEP